MKQPAVVFKDNLVDFKCFTYNEYLLHRVAMIYLQTGKIISYEQAISIDTDWEYQVKQMAKWHQTHE